MTTIIYDTHNKTMYADTLVVQGNIIVGEINKINRVGDYVIGFGGLIELMQPFHNFIITGNAEELDEKLKFQAIVVNSNTYEVVNYINSLKPSYETSDFHCLGTGTEMARALLKAQIKPDEAIKIISKIDVNTNDKVNYLKV